MGQQTNRGYKLDQNGQEVQDILNRVYNKQVPVKCKTTAEWDAMTGYIPLAGEIIVYSDYKEQVIGGVTVNIPGIKVGSGNGYVQDLAFLGQDDADTLLGHISNSNIHVTASEKSGWNNKLNVDDDYEVVNETLIFNRN